MRCLQGRPAQQASDTRSGSLDDPCSLGSSFGESIPQLSPASCLARPAAEGCFTSISSLWHRSDSCTSTLQLRDIIPYVTQGGSLASQLEFQFKYLNSKIFGPLRFPFNLWHPTTKPLPTYTLTYHQKEMGGGGRGRGNGGGGGCLKCPALNEITYVAKVDPKIYNIQKSHCQLTLEF